MKPKKAFGWKSFLFIGLFSILGSRLLYNYVWQSKTGVVISAIVFFVFLFGGYVVITFIDINRKKH